MPLAATTEPIRIDGSSPAPLSCANDVSDPLLLPAKASLQSLRLALVVAAGLAT